MKKTAIALIAAASISAAASAQDYTQDYLIDNPVNKTYFGIRAGLDISSTAGDHDSFGNGAGFTVGAVCNIPIDHNIFIEPGLYAFYNTFDNDIDTWKPSEDLYNVYDGSIRNWGIRVPFNIGYRLDFTNDISLAIFTGPVLNVNLSAKAYCDGLDNYTYSMMEYKDFKRIDAQWDFGISMNYGSHYYVGITGAVGITEAYKPKGDDVRFRRNTVNIAVGYNF